MKIVAFGASNSSKSINQALAGYSAQLFQKEINPEAKIELLDLNDYEMPIYSIDRENSDGLHPLAVAFFDKISNADAIIISFAEHNGHFSSAFKNIYDWASRIESKVFQGKPAVFLSTSPGKAGAASVLRHAVESAPFYGADLKASLSVPQFYENFDHKTGTITDEEINAQLLSALEKLQS